MKEHEFFNDLVDRMYGNNEDLEHNTSNIGKVDRVILSTGDEFASISMEGINTKNIKINNVDIEDIIKDKIKKYDENRVFSDEILSKLLEENIKDLEDKLKEEIKEKIAKDKRRDINYFIATIDKVYFGKGTTVIKWKDGTTTKVKCQDGEEFDKEKGVAMCIIKHMFGDIGYYNEIFRSLNLDEDITEAKPGIKNSEIKNSKIKRHISFTLGDLFGF
jgi:hypothetical protein